MMVTRKINLGALIAGSLLIGMWLTGCNTPTPPSVEVVPEEPPGEVAEVPSSTSGAPLSDFQVRRNIATVWATLTNISSMDKLTSSNWENLIVGGLVSCDETGEAQLRSDSCDAIYLFQNSGLMMSSCAKEDLGDVACSVEGTMYFDDCGLQIQTASGDLSWESTTLSVTYLPNSRAVEAVQMTLVIVFDGTVFMQPVTQIDGRVMSDDVIEVPSQMFAYTAPDAVLDEIEEITGVSPRLAQPLGELPALIETFELQPWMDKVGEKAEDDGFPFPPGSPDLVLGGGGSFEDPSVQEAVLSAVPWGELLDRQYPGRNVSISWEGDEQAVFASDLAYDRFTALALLKRESFSGVLFFPRDDGQLAALALDVVSGLSAVGITLEVQELPDPNTVTLMREAGETFLLMSRR